MGFNYYNSRLDDVEQKIILWLDRLENLNYSSNECLDVLEQLYIEHLDLTEILLSLGGDQ